jgi:hypothetical protein
MATSLGLAARALDLPITITESNNGERLASFTYMCIYVSMYIYTNTCIYVMAMFTAASLLCNGYFNCCITIFAVAIRHSLVYHAFT